jgi:hypothetical protein
LKFTYTPTKLLPGDGELLRQHGYTRWMSADLLQPASEFLRNLHLLPLYAECSSEKLYRYLCWHHARDPDTVGLNSDHPELIFFL